MPLNYKICVRFLRFFESESLLYTPNPGLYILMYL